MKIQVNSDKTIAVDASMTRFVDGEVNRVLGRFAGRLTRVEVHLSDVDNKKTGQADKRCLIEARPARAQPQTASAKATKLAAAVGEAAHKMQRLLTTFFGRKGRRAVSVSGPGSKISKPAAQKATPGTIKSAAVKKSAVSEPAMRSGRGPKEKGIYQARRKSWPAR